MDVEPHSVSIERKLDSVQRIQADPDFLCRFIHIFIGFQIYNRTSVKAPDEPYTLYGKYVYIVLSVHW